MGIRADGFEINPVLLLYTRLKCTCTLQVYTSCLVLIVPICAAFAGFNHRARFRFKNLWDVNLREYDIIWCFGVQSFMGRLEEKARRECHEHAFLVLFRFHLPDTQPVAKFGEVRIYRPGKECFHNLHKPIFIGA
jgi:hypothetical protein